MQMKRLGLFLVAFCAASPVLAQQTQAPPPKNDAIAPPLAYAADVLKASPRHGEWVDIKMAAGPALKTWVTYPERAGKVGVVLVIHDIYGMPNGAGDWPRAVGDQLAKEGFIAIVPDLLSGKGPNGGGADDIVKAGMNIGQVIQTLTMADVAAKLDAALAYGKSLPSSNGKTGVIGFCWGGDKSFGYAAAQPGLSAAVVYYGQVPQTQPGTVDEAAVAKIEAPVIGFYGGTDSRVNNTIEMTRTAMAKLGKSYDPHIFEGAGHGFLRAQTGPVAGSDANYKASVEAWPLTIAFLTKNLK
jgi:carboxymethylenebutenolidase